MDNHPAPIAAAVYRWYTARGVQCRFAPDAPGELTSIGRQETDAEAQIRWLAHGVAPVVKRLLDVYPESDLYAVLFCGASPDSVAPLNRKGDSELAAFDAWTVENRVAVVNTTLHSLP